jgi:hypothetical protein
MRKARGSAHRKKPDGRLALPLPIERTWTSDHDAELAALRVILQLPRVPAGEPGKDEV